MWLKMGLLLLPTTRQPITSVYLKLSTSQETRTNGACVFTSCEKNFVTPSPNLNG